MSTVDVQQGAPAHATSWMRHEIGEQPEAVRRTLERLLPLTSQLRSVARDCRAVLFIARGSSDNAALYGQYLCSVRAGRLGVPASPSVATAYQAHADLSGVLAVAISQSGATEEIVQTLEWAARNGARTVAITNHEESPLVDVAEIGMVTQAGTERAVPATKTYTTQLAALAVLGLSLADDDQALADLRHVPDAIEAALEMGSAAEEMAQVLTYVDRLVVTGRGYTASTALELALKLKEACYVAASGLSYADLLHGPIALVDAHTPAVLVAPSDGPMLADLTSLAARVHRSGSQAYGLGGNDSFQRACRAALDGPRLPEHLAPLALVVPGQLLVEALARAKGLDPDRPRGLSKVTQTDLRANGVTDEQG